MYGAWARFQHLWLAERAATLAALAALAGDAAAAGRAATSCRPMPRATSTIPTATTCSGPAGCSSRPTSSRSGSPTISRPPCCCAKPACSPDATCRGRRRPWPTRPPTSSASSTRASPTGRPGTTPRSPAIAVWFEDEELAGARGARARPASSPTWCTASARTACGTRARTTTSSRCAASCSAMGWARQAGVDLLADRAPRRAAGRGAPGAGAHRAARLHLSGPQGLAVRRVAGAADVPRALGGRARPAGRRAATRRSGAGCAELYAVAAPQAAALRLLSPRGGRARADRPATPRRISPGGRCWRWLRRCPSRAEPWRPGSVLLEGQGLAVLRDGERYASLECGSYGGGHGHPDRLHLTLHADGVHWLPDPGTGSYVARDLFWYRSTLAHNAPRLDGVSQPPGDARCDDFERAMATGPGSGPLRRADAYAGRRAGVPARRGRARRQRGAVLELPWHLDRPGRGASRRGLGAGRARRRVRAATWSASSRCRRAAGRPPGAAPDGAAARAVHLPARRRAAPRHRRPGLPERRSRRRFTWCARGAGTSASSSPCSSHARRSPASVRVRDRRGRSRWRPPTGWIATWPAAEGWEVDAGRQTVRLAGIRRHRGRRSCRWSTNRPLGTEGSARPGRRAAGARRHAGRLRRRPSRCRWTTRTSIAGARSPTPGPEEFSATAAVNWDDEALYLAVDVVKPRPIVRARRCAAAAARQRAGRHPQRWGPGVPASPARRAGLRVPHRALDGRATARIRVRGDRAAPPATPEMVTRRAGSPPMSGYAI